MTDEALSVIIKEARESIDKFGGLDPNWDDAVVLALAEDLQGARAELQHLRAVLFERAWDDKSLTALPRMTAQDFSDYIERISQRAFREG